MKIVTLVKQVPATQNVKIDPDSFTMLRDQMELELNPLDLYAN